MPCFADPIRDLFQGFGEGEVIDSIEQSYGQICSRRIEFVQYEGRREMNEAVQTFANCQVLQQSLLHRVERLMVSSGSMITDKNIYGLALLIRGHWEATAMMG
jgi:hypothetical protein